MSVLDTVARPDSPKRRIKVSFIRVRILAICSRIVFSILADEADYVGKILETDPSSVTGLSERPSNLSLPSTFVTRVVTSTNTACNDSSAIEVFLTALATLDAA